MENTPINLCAILEQARDWTFDGDFQILQWMNKLSQNLEARATTTTENLDRLNNNVKSTHVALDNVANSLTALQYGNQFVECRVQDDDETSMTGENEAIVANGVDASTKPLSMEILSIFLNNNLKVLRNCHEKYSIDIDDSDEEDEKTGKTYIFQPINPYNEKPLPHIFGSKEWCEKWHVGLSNDDQDNNYSGDEISEAYSESSSCSAAPDNDSYETNSEFASSVSLNNDNFASSNLERNVSTLKRTKVENVSETSSTHSSAAKLSIHNAQSHDFIGDIHAVSTSLSSSQSKTDDSFRKLKDSNAATNTRKTTTSRANIPPYVDLFAEPPEDLGSTSSNTSLVENILHNPVNFFNDEVDDVFKHLAIAQSKRTNPPVPSERTNTKPKSPHSFEQKSTTPNTKASVESKVPHSGVSVILTQKLDDENQITGGMNSRTPKSLFDDDDDEDFLSAFVKRQKSFGNPKLLENPAVLPINSNKEDIFKNSRQDSEVKPSNVIIGNENRNSNEQIEPQNTKAQNTFINLFDDVQDEYLEVVTQKSASIMQTSKVIAASSDTRENDNMPTGSSANIMKSTNLFDDDDDDDDFFKTLPSARSNLPSEIFNKNKDGLISSSGVDRLKTVPSLDLSIIIQTQHKDKIINSSSMMVQTEGICKQNQDFDTDNDLFKTSTQSSVPNQVVSSSKTSSRVLNENLADGDNFQFTRPTIPAKTVDDTEDKSLAKKSNDIEDILPGNRETSNQNTINILLDDAENENVLTSVSSEVVQTHTDSETQKECLSSKLEVFDVFNESSMDENIFENEKDNSEEPATSKTTMAVEKLHEDLKIGMLDKTNNDLDKNNDVFLAREIEERAYMSEVMRKSPKNQEFNGKQNKMHTAKAINGTNSDSEDHKNKDHVMSNIGNTTEQTEKINIGENLNIITQNKSTPLTKIKIPTQNTIDLSEEELKKPDSELNISKDEKKFQKYGLNSSFLFDEPPDDDDNHFFDSLGKMSHQSITKYNSFDLENDLYPEPQLPKIPNTEVCSSTYAGLQLFDDIPPDDDGFHETKTQKPETSKRLNTVFYDDFHETLEALNGRQEQKSVSTHSILSNEPPPDLNDGKAKFGIQTNDVVDFVKPDLQGGVASESSANIKDFDVHIKPAFQQEDTSKPYNKNRSISKLPHPNININVETLLPFGGGIPPSLRMIQKENKNQEIVSTPNISNESSETSHILHNINKTRVRAPLNRRPSTRKARQENYRKSLLDEEILSNDDEKHNENIISILEVQPKPMVECKLKVHKTDDTGNMEIMEHSESINATQPRSISHHIMENVKAQSSTNSRELKVPPNPLPIQRTPSFTEQEVLYNTPEIMSNKRSILTKNPELFDEKDYDENDKDIFKVITAKKLFNASNEKAASLENEQMNSDTNTNPSSFNETPQNLLKFEVSNEIEAGLLPQNTTSEKYKTPLINVIKSASELKNSTKMLFTDSESDDDLFSNLSSTKPRTIESPKRDRSYTVPAAKTLETRKTSMIKQNTSLFSDDSDEDDNFLKTTSRTKVVAKNTPKVAPQTKSIFTDIEGSDDDDLFGGNSKVITKTMNTTQINVAEAKQPIKTTIADNPLADLL